MSAPRADTLAACTALRELAQRLQRPLATIEATAAALEATRPHSCSIDTLLEYRRLDSTERAETLARAEDERHRADLPVAGTDDSSRWQRGWQQILDSVAEHGLSKESLLPQYFHYDIVRWNGDYARVSDTRFEATVYEIVRRVLFDEYLGDAETIVDLGCGTGANLWTMAEMFPHRHFVGCDWAPPSQELVRRIAVEHGYSMSALALNMLTLEGAETLQIDDTTAVVTLHSLEQLGSRFDRLLSFLLQAGPRICVHIEPIVELYDESDSFDRVAADYHRTRGYLEGFLPALRSLESQGLVTIRECRRLGLGSTFQEGYSVIVWTPNARST